ncbi:MAG: hypothetical protein EOP88_20025, partial [Verrucomicrobiaceae bacterium]
VLPDVTRVGDLAYGNDTINGHAGNDSLIGGDGNDTMSGGDGNDNIDGGNGDDIISGNAGDDTIAGGSGKDVYHYALGDGNDTYTDIAGIHQANDATADYSDLHFGAGITPGMLRSRFNSSLGTLKFEVQDTAGGSITVNSWNVYSGSTDVTTSRRWRFHFQDGTVWSGQLFWNEDLSTPFQGFTGGILHDTLQGSAEAEGLRGLQGDDFLQGDAGDDSYYYQWGSGNDIIEDAPSTGDLTIVYITGENLENHLTHEFVYPDSLKIKVSHPSDPSKDGSVVLQGWYGTQPVTFKDNWRVFVQGATGAYDISQKMRFMGTNGPDVVVDLPFHTGNGHTFDAGAGDDSIHGSNWGETILGNLGDDKLYGLGGGDSLNGGDGNDTLSGGADHDSLVGGIGEDILKGDDGGDDLFGEDGNDILVGGNGDDLLEGGAGNDQLRGEDGNDTLNGGTGDDEMDGGFGSDVYEWNLGDGRDTINDSIDESVPSLENHLHFGTGVAPEQIKVFVGTDNSLIFSVRDLQDEEVGNVTINNWFTRNDAASGTGNHSKTWRIDFADSPLIWDGRFLTTAGPDVISGGAGNDTLQGAEGDDTLLGMQGEDILQGGDGRDHLDGGEDDDELSGGSGRDILSGGAGDDILRGNDGSDILDGNAGDDQLYGGSGNDVLTGGDGNDTYHWSVGDGNDTLVEYPSSNATAEINTISFGGEVAPGVEISDLHVKVTSSGQDYGFFAVFDPAGNQIALLTVRNWGETKERWRIRFPQDQQSTTWSRLAELTDFHLEGAYDIEADGETEGSIIGSNYGDSLAGGLGNDTISGLDGDDQISGHEGKDSLYGGQGSDILVGGEGDDRLIGDGGSDMILGGSGDDLIEGGDGDDLIEGGLGNDVVDGGAGDDRLDGGAGDDRLEGGAGDDRLEGREGADTLRGGLGDDIIQGGPGNDSLSGDQGADTYIWNLGDGDDVIRNVSDGVGEVQEEDVLLLGPGIAPQDVRQEFIPATPTALPKLKITIVNEAQQGIGSLVLPFADSSGQIAGLGLKVRMAGGRNMMLATPNDDRIAGTYVDDVIDALSGDDVVEASAGDDVISGGPGNDRISCGIGNNVITGGSGDDVTIVEGGHDVHHWNLGDGHDRIVRKMPNFPVNFSVNGLLVLGPGILPRNVSFEVVDKRMNGKASLKVIIKNNDSQVVGSVMMEDVLVIEEGDMPFPALESGFSAYLNNGRYRIVKKWRHNYEIPFEIDPDTFEIEFSDQKIWNLKIGGGLVYPSAGDYGSNIDTDQDGMDDQWEIHYGMNPISNGETGSSSVSIHDLDGDGLSNVEEYKRKTDPTVVDVVDPPIIAVVDDDSDLMSVAYETANGLDPLSNDAMLDNDGDGFPNVWEFLRGTRSDDPGEFPGPDYIVDKVSGDLSFTDNIVSSVSEAAGLANMSPGNGIESAIIAVRSGDYVESVRFDHSVLLMGESSEGGGIPTIRCPEDRQALSFMNANRVSSLFPEPGVIVSGIRVTHTDGKLGPAIFSFSEMFLRNCIIDNNETDVGSAVFGRVSLVEHCTIAGNSSAGGVYFGWLAENVEITNSILWNNGDNSLDQLGYYDDDQVITYSVQNSIIQGGFMGASNIDPLLNFSGLLKPASPAIDMIASSGGSGQANDIHGESRHTDGTPDIGADEYHD